MLIGRYPLSPSGASQTPARVGRYRLCSELGRGGMGVVHLAVDDAGHTVAIKMLRESALDEPDARARLAREVDHLSRIDHPGVAGIIDADVTGARPYVVTRYVPGPSLDRYISQQGPLRPVELFSLAADLSVALSAVHAVGVVHRDLKPANILLQDGHPVLIDFGIAFGSGDARLTSTGLVMGTPGFLAPEILDGADVDTSTDWWAWAATLAYAASGRVPFGDRPVDAVLARIRAGECDLSGVDPALAPLLRAALDPRPFARPTQRQILAELERYAHAHGATGATVGLPAMTATTVMPGAGATRPHRVAPARTAAAAAMATPPPWGPPGGAPHAPTTRPTARAGATAAWPTPANPPMPATATTPAQAVRTRFQRVIAASSDAARTHLQSVLPTRAQSGPPAGYASWNAAPTAPPPYGTTPHPGAAPTASGWHPPQQHLGKPAAAPPHPGAAMSGGHHKPGPSPYGQPSTVLDRGGRALTTLSLGVFLACLTLMAPVYALFFGVFWSWLTRTVDRVMTGHYLRRSSYGAGQHDIIGTVLRSPMNIILAATGTVLSAFFPLLVGYLGILLGVVGQDFGVIPGSPLNPSAPVPLFMGGVSTLIMAWWGPGGSSVRRGTRMTVRALTPPPLGPVLMTLLFLVAAAVVGLISQSTGHLPVWGWLGPDPFSWVRG
ncbi:Serine/threonine-protein kinase PknD [Austwickia sp. TVS 96-490-7B]|uniref:protein kinase domain-containing protein n=1 Tax=Austwickia sp. TVS 96-490-7B TaxID=2830843 RepID=UPI001E030EB4|nr:serine/threonine protein kinase [Austwickia sp. TVS 96-490-7B]MBW3083829.1 Serine/threonine-protein kinase PknD [Austwickia sp. TVS 96-490-7B]